MGHGMRLFSFLRLGEKSPVVVAASCLALLGIKYLWKSTGRSPSFPCQRAHLGATCLVQTVHQRCRTLLPASIAPRHPPARTRLLANILLKARVVLKFSNTISLMRKRCHVPATQIRCHTLLLLLPGGLFPNPCCKGRLYSPVDRRGAGSQHQDPCLETHHCLLLLN